MLIFFKKLKTAVFFFFGFFCFGGWWEL